MSPKRSKLELPEPERFEDVFQDEVCREFLNITEFQKFARSKDGLCLDEIDIQHITENNTTSVEDQKMGMLWKWKFDKGEDATVLIIRHLVKKYNKGDQSDEYIQLDGNYGVFKNKSLCKRGHVYLGEQKSSITGTHLCAIKLFQFNKENLREAQILSKLRNHVNVVSILHADKFQGFPYDYIYVVMELCWTKNLRDFFDECEQLAIPFDEKRSFDLIHQSFTALTFIHAQKIIHRDLKHENILVSDNKKHVKLTDFGFSKILNDTPETSQSKSNIGTDGYRSPETYKNDKISQKSDIFSAGILLAESMSNGKHPFGDNPYRWSDNIMNSKNLDLRHLLVSDKTRAEYLIISMLQFNPENRPTAKEILNNDFFQQSKSTQLSIEENVLDVTQKANTLMMFDRSDKFIYSYTPSTKEWSQMQKFDHDCPFTVVASGDYIYMLRKKEVHRLKYSDPKAEWHRVADMGDDHGYWPAAGMFNGSIYVCGSDFYSCSPHVERIIINWNQWIRINDMNTARRSPCIVATKDHIYCIGGRDEQEKYILLVERFSGKDGGWKYIPQVPRGILSRASAAVLENRIYIADDEGVLCFDIQNNTWSTMNISDQWPFQKKIVESFYRLKILTVDENLYLIGRTSKDIMAIFSLDPRTETMFLLEEKNSVSLQLLTVFLQRCSYSWNHVVANPRSAYIL